MEWIIAEVGQETIDKKTQELVDFYENQLAQSGNGNYTFGLPNPK